MHWKVKMFGRMRHRWIEGAIGWSEVQRLVDELSGGGTTGAVQLFVGQVRADVVDGKVVRSIVYSCYRELADRVLDRLIDEARSRFGLQAVGVLHSVGEVEVGQWSVAVCCCAAHRKSTMEAVQWIMDRLKREVPIFGREVFVDEGYRWKKSEVHTS